MAPPESASLVAALASLAVAAVVLARRQRSPGTSPLLLAVAGLTVWHLADFFSERIGEPTWLLIAALGSIMVAPALVHFGRATLRIGPSRLVTVAYALAVVFLGIVMVGFFHETAGRQARSWGWIAYVVLFYPPLVASVLRLAHAAATDRDPVARKRALRLGVGIATGMIGAGFDLVALGNPWVPKLGSVGTIAGTLALGWSIDVDAGSRGALATRSALLAVAVTAGAVLLLVALRDLTQDQDEVALLVGGGAALAGLAAFRLGMARIQREAQRVQSLALLGTFAAEVAHEVRNPLAAIRGAVQFLREEARRGGLRDDLASYLELVDDEVERLDQVVTGYHSLARPTSLQNQRVDAGKVVRDLSTLQQRAIPTNVTLRVEVDDGLPLVRGDAGRLRQALLNLVRNAVHAMPSGGTLTIRARSEQGRKRDRTVLLEVEDSGVGISKKDLDSVFKPFYSTSAGGSGLGLAVTQRIAEEHQGTLLVRSAAGKGSIFALVLPAEEVGAG